MKRVAIVSYARTPITKHSNPKHSQPDSMIQPVIKAALRRAWLSPTEIDDIFVGNVLDSADAVFQARSAAVRVGINLETPVLVVNRQCGSGLEAMNIAALSILKGDINTALCIGYELMSRDRMKTVSLSIDDEISNGCKLSMGETAENIAAKFKISREDADKFAFESQKKAKMAAIKNITDWEILNDEKLTNNLHFPLLDKIKQRVKARNEKKENETSKVVTAIEESDLINKKKSKSEDSEDSDKQIIVTMKDLQSFEFKDEGIRDTTLEVLGKLRAVFRHDGICTAGNSSQLSDAAAGIILMSDDNALINEMNILGYFSDYVAVGVDPSIMGVGPIYAIRKLLKKNNLKDSDIDVYEINEAFAAQAICCIQELNIDRKKVNPYGGAIALGHPLGATGIRMVGSILNYMIRNGKKKGIVSLCVGSGMGVAALITRD